MVSMYSLDVAILLHIDLICVKSHKLTHHTFKKKENFSKKFFQNFQNFFLSNLAELCSEKGIFKSSKKIFLKKKIFCCHFFFENCNTIAKNRLIK